MKKLSSFVTGTIIFLLLFGMFFGMVKSSRAQSVQGWSKPVNLSMSGAASNPALVADSNGVLHAIWFDRFEGYKYAESADGVTWTSPKTVNFPFYKKTGLAPVLIADKKGFIHIFWRGDKNEFMYAQSTGEGLDAPSVWRATTNLDTSVFDFDASMDAQGRLHLVYVKNPTPTTGTTDAFVPAKGTAGVFYRGSSNGGLGWTGAKLLYESPYFRSLSPEQARIRLAVSDDPGEQHIYAVWDDRPQKRILMATSRDGGGKWDPIKELITPQASLGFGTPYHADVDILGNNLLVTWQVGEPGKRCTPYSRASIDGGENWDAPVKILAGSAQCPERGEFISIDPAYSVELFTIQGDLSLSAWNGSGWSNPELQTGPSSITNPATFEPVLLGCEQAVASDNRLFVVGCDQGLSGDIWFISRQFDSLESLFPQPSAWGGDADVTTTTQTITSLVSATDDSGGLHTLWVQHSDQDTSPVAPTIQYARWNGENWSKPAPIITNLGGVPSSLSLQIDSRQRLLLSWVNQQTGELLFSWADSERANIPREWSQPTVLSSQSQLTNSPDMLADASNRIVIAYAITLNEKRGIYLIQSTDFGATWSLPVHIFDAASAGWEMVDQPRITVTEDGRLHALFTRYSLLGEQRPVGPYYSQSDDGGTTWTDPEIVVEQSVPWSRIAAHNGILHRVWQEENRAVISTRHQFSSDNGITWSSPISLPGDSAAVSAPVVFLDLGGGIRFLQIEQGEIATIKEWGWIEQRWQLVETRRIGVLDPESRVVIDGGITSRGVMYALIQIESPLPEDGTETRLLNIRRSIELTGPAQSFSASISTPSVASLSTAIPEIESTPTTKALPLADLGDPRSPMIRNLAGLSLILIVAFLILVFTLPRRRKPADRVKKSD